MKIIKFFQLSSIGKKVITALAGAFLAVFLLVHLTINLLMLRGDEGAMFTQAAHFMASNIIIKVFEIVLFSTFALHIFEGLILTFQNWRARGKARYKVTNKSETSFFSKYMFHTGVVIFIFLILHFINFYFVKIGIVEAPENIDKEDFYSMAILLFTNKTYSIIYIIAFVGLGLHLNHAIQSAFQSFGANHSKYTSAIKALSTVYALIISVGFSILPIYFMFFYQIKQ